MKPKMAAAEVEDYGKNYKNGGYGVTASELNKRGVAIFTVKKNSRERQKEHILFHLFPRGERPKPFADNYLSVVLRTKKLVRDFHDIDNSELAKHLYKRGVDRNTHDLLPSLANSIFGLQEVESHQRPSRVAVHDLVSHIDLVKDAHAMYLCSRPQLQQRP